MKTAFFCTVIFLFLTSCIVEQEETNFIQGKYGCIGTKKEVLKCEKTKDATKPPKFTPIDHGKGY